ncbi:hypothetical protein ACHRVZ_19675 [Flavobacterium sp. FlaQc-57]
MAIDDSVAEIEPLVAMAATATTAKFPIASASPLLALFTVLIAPGMPVAL